MKSPKIEHAYSIFNNKIGLYNINFIEHCVVEDGQFFKSFVEKREREGGFRETMVIYDRILSLLVLSEL